MEIIHLNNELSHSALVFDITGHGRGITWKTPAEIAKHSLLILSVFIFSSELMIKALLLSGT